MSLIQQISAFINDAITSSTTVWSSQKITNELAAFTGGLIFKGAYNPVTNTPDLVTPLPGVVSQGDFYVCSVSGTFFGQVVEPGDALIAAADNPSTVFEWVILQANQLTQNLENILLVGNTSGPYDIVMDDTQKIQLGSNAVQFLNNVDANTVTLSVNRFLDLVIASSGSNAHWAFDDAQMLGEDDDFSMAINYVDGTILWNDKTGIVNTLEFNNTAASRNWLMPPQSGTIALTSDITTPTLEAVIGAGNFTGVGQTLKVTNTEKIQFGNNTNNFIGNLDGSSVYAGVVNLFRFVFSGGANSNCWDIRDETLEGDSLLFNMELDFHAGTITWTDKSTGYVGAIDMSSITASQNWAMPDKSGTVALTSDLYPQTVNIAVGDSPYAAVNNQFIICDSTGGDITVNLPAAVANYKISVLKKVAANNVIVDGNGAETINGALTATLTAQWEMVTLISDGTEWYVGV